LPSDQLYWCHRPLPGTKPRDITTQGSVAAEAIESLPEDVREVLVRQKSDIESGASTIVYPVRFFNEGLSHTNFLPRGKFAAYFGLLPKKAEEQEVVEPPRGIGRKLASLLGRNRTP
jgi:hypothetical protein